MCKHRICIIICYFGELPWYFNFFVESCRYNPTVDFLLITDTATFLTPLPKNIHPHFCTLSDLNKRIYERLNIISEITEGYKVCDVRPMFGMLFDDLIDGFHFWGYGDLDVIYGDIRKFFDDKLLSQYDIFSVRKEYLTGFFTLFRNEQKINFLFKSSRDFKYVLESNRYLGFDECGLMCMPLINGAKLENLICEVESLTHIVLRPGHRKLRAYFDFHVVEGSPGNLVWNQGKLIYAGRYEVILYHLISFKCHPLLEIPNWKDVPDIFYINEFSFSKS